MTQNLQKKFLPNFFNLSKLSVALSCFWGGKRIVITFTGVIIGLGIGSNNGSNANMNSNGTSVMSDQVSK